MNVKAKILGAAMGAFGLVGLSSAALAGSTTPPGERIGLDLASPLPEGVYFADVAGVGTWRDGPSNGNSTLNYNVPVVVWSTPWTILGGHLQFWAAAAPELTIGYNHVNGAPGGLTSFLGATGGGYAAAIYNPFVAGQMAWNLGNGFSLSGLVGAYLPITTGDLGNLLNRTTIAEMISLAYHNSGWNVTINVYGGQILDQQDCTSTPFATCANNSFVNYDLAVTHTFGKWEFGVVGIGSTDYDNHPTSIWSSGVQQAQFAVGGLMGYNFGPVIMQLIVATDIYKKNYNAYDTQGILHVIVPVWAPEVPKAVVAKY